MVRSLEDEPINDETLSDSNKLEIMDLNKAVSVECPPKLLRLNMNLVFFDGSNVNLMALIDGGATHSVLKLEMLPVGVQKEIKNFWLMIKGYTNKLNLKRKPFMKVCPMSKNRENMVQIKAKVKIQNNYYTHNFYVSNEFLEPAIIGRDFLKLHNVVIDHGSDELGFITRKVNEVMDQPVVIKANTIVKPRSENVIKANSTFEENAIALCETNDDGLSFM